MKNKMAINTHLETIESKNKLSKQEEQRQHHGYGQGFDSCPVGRQCGGNSEEVRGVRSTNR